MSLNVYQTTRKEHLEYIKNQLISMKTDIENTLIARNFQKDTSDRITYIANLYYIYLKICDFLENINDKRLLQIGENFITVLIKTLNHIKFNLNIIRSFIKEEEIRENLAGQKIRFINYVKQHEDYMKLLMEYKELREKSSSIFYFFGFEEENFSHL